MAIKKLAKQEAQRYTNLSLEYKTDTGIVYALINTIKELKEQINKNNEYETLKK